MNPTITTIVLITAVAGSIIHFYPSWLTKPASQQLFKLWGAPITAQRIIGLVSGVGLLILTYQTWPW